MILAEEIIRNDFDTLDQVVTNFMDKFGGYYRRIF